MRPFWSGSLCSLLAALCLATLAAAQDAAPQRLLLLAQGPDGHPAGTHEYVAGMRVLAKSLAGVPNLETTLISADGAWPEGPGLINKADGVVLFLSQGAKWIHEDPRRLEAFAQLAARGGGLVTLHWGMGTREAQYIDGFLKLFGGCHGGPDRKFLVLETRLSVVAGEHPIVRGIGDLPLREEFYYQLKFIDPQRIQPILQAEIEGRPETVAWAWQRGDGGRSFGFSGGHFHEHWRHVQYRRLMAQGTLWTLKLPIPPDGLPVKVSEEDLKLSPQM